MKLFFCMEKEEIAASFTMDLEGGNAELEFAENLVRHRNHVADDRRLVPFEEVLASFTMEGVDADAVIQESNKRLLHRVADDGQQIHQDPFSHQISKVHIVRRGVSPSSFDPKMVPIGPLHKEHENVKATQGKVKALFTLLELFGSQREEIQRRCICKVRTSLNKIKKFYPDVFDNDKIVNDAEIVDLLYYDALFILGFCLQYKEFCDNTRPLPKNMQEVDGIMHDLVLLENQIPLFILYDILVIIKPIIWSISTTSLVELLLPVLSYHKLFDTDINVNTVSINDIPHILGLLHNCYRPPQHGSITSTRSTSRIRSSVVLHKSGVNFEPNAKQTSNWVMEIKMTSPSFWSGSKPTLKPTLRMPVLRVVDHTESVLRNLIAYECEYAHHKYITSYVCGMQMLVKTEEDVALLEDSGVLHVNCTSSHEQVAKMFNNILKNVTVFDNFYEEGWITMNKYYDSWTAWLWRIYSSIDWKLILTIIGVSVATASLTVTIRK